MIAPKITLGVYSDSGLNNLELSLIETDGIDIYAQLMSLLRPYPIELKDALFSFMRERDFTNTQRMKALEKQVTAFHCDCITEFITQCKRKHPHIGVIGYSGHVVYHHPQDKITIALGHAQEIANKFKIPVVTHFIQSDFKAGGCGGPLFSTFYDALTRNIQKPLCILSLGGLTTLTSIGPFGEMQAFDVGVGTALLDLWVYKKTGAEMDFNGYLADKGHIDERLLSRLLKEPYFIQIPPKTVDKGSVTKLYEQVEGSSISDGAATLTAFVAKSILKARAFLKEQPSLWILIGGGINNPVLVRMIKKELPEQVKTALDFGWEYETLNAKSYAFLAVRSLMRLPISFPQTSGVQEPVTGGTLILPQPPNN